MPFTRIDDQQRRMRARRAGHHVLEKLDVSGRVDDDVVTSGALEEDAGRINRDSLRLFILERIEQEGVLERLGVALAIGSHRLQLALRQRPRVCQQAPDDGALAVVDVAGDHDGHPLQVGNVLLRLSQRLRRGWLDARHCRKSPTGRVGALLDRAIRPAVERPAVAGAATLSYSSR